MISKVAPTTYYQQFPHFGIWILHTCKFPSLLRYLVWWMQRRKNLGSRVALLPGKFLRVWKVFGRITEKNLLNCPNTLKAVWIFPDDFQFSGWFQN